MKNENEKENMARVVGSAHTEAARATASAVLPTTEQSPTPDQERPLPERIAAFLAYLRDAREFSRGEMQHQRRVRNAYETGARAGEVGTMGVVIAELERWLK